MTRTPPTYTARGPLDLVALVPFLLGFHPADSVVLLTFGGAEPFHLRIDLPADLGEQEDVAAGLREVVGRHRVPQVAVLVYTDDAELARSMATTLVGGLVADGLEVVDAIRVEPGEFFDALDPLRSGTAYDLSVHPFTASRVFAGQVALESRERLADTLVTTDPEDADEVLHAAVRFADHVEGLLLRGTPPDAFVRDEAGWLRETVRAGLRRPLLAPEVGRLLVLLTHLPLRDLAIAQVTRDDAADHVALWRDVVRRAAPRLRAAPAALLALTAWLLGDGALAWCALDRCGEADPDYAMARELSRLLQHGVAPSAWVPMPEDVIGALKPPQARSA